MLKELKFVQGAVAKKDFIPAMTHFAIEDGVVRAYNGVIALSSPIPFDINCKPKAVPLVQAINNCQETVTLSMTPAGKLKIQSGKFRAHIECVHEETPHVEPEGNHIDIDGEALLKAITTIESFIGNDASRPWSNGVLLRGSSVFATNNVCLIEYWVGTPFPLVVNLPRVAIKEMLRINEAPTHAQATESSVTFHYADGRWIRTQVLSAEWPDLARVLDHISDQKIIDPRIFEGIQAIKPFADQMGRVLFSEGLMHTHPELGEGATYDLQGTNIKGVYQIEMLKLLEGVAKTADFSRYPDATLFIGENLRGAIIGMRG